MKFKSKTNPFLVVELLSQAELRIAETKRSVIIYAKGEVLYVRPKEEFFDKFELDDAPILN